VAISVANANGGKAKTCISACRPVVSDKSQIHNPAAKLIDNTFRTTYSRYELAKIFYISPKGNVASGDSLGRRQFAKPVGSGDAAIHQKIATSDEGAICSHQ